MQEINIGQTDRAQLLREKTESLSHGSVRINILLQIIVS